MIKCEQNDCNEKAAFTVCWPNQVTRQCADHTQKLVALGRHLGITVPIIPFLDIDPPLVADEEGFEREP